MEEGVPKIETKEDLNSKIDKMATEIKTLNDSVVSDTGLLQTMERPTGGLASGVTEEQYNTLFRKIQRNQESLSVLRREMDSLINRANT